MPRYPNSRLIESQKKGEKRREGGETKVAREGGGECTATLCEFHPAVITFSLGEKSFSLPAYTPLSMK